MLLDDLKHFESVAYHVDREPTTLGRIGYKDQDGVSYTRTCRYKTLFAYFKEHERPGGLVDAGRLKENTCLLVNCGSFSYAAVPKLYDSVIGATGTLKTLSDGQKKILRDVYHVHDETFMPSVYSDRQLVFNHRAPGPESMFKIFKKTDFHGEIRKEIDRRRLPALAGLPERPVLVFFETDALLMAFKNSSYMRDIRENVGAMNEGLSPAERAIMIGKAVQVGSVTLLTREFGRGIDFVPFDEKLIRSGGVHVLQTFVSLEISEEVQIKGRTARQGKPGSFSMVLCEEELEWLALTPPDLAMIRAGGAGYELIDRARRAAFNRMYENAQGSVDAVEGNHKESQQFLEHLYNGRVEEIKQFIAERNHCHVSGSEISYTLCLIDATGSMGNVIQNTKTCVSLMFERAHKVLQEEKVASADFQLQIAVYRNYNSSPQDLLEYSQWASEPEDIRAFISSIQASGGFGEREAVEVGLWHANRVHETLKDKGEQLNQVILIGDAPPNTKAEVGQKRAYSGRDWSQSDFAVETFADDETAKLIENEIPVHCFYVQSYNQMEPVRQGFTAIAHATNPTSPVCQQLDVRTGQEGANVLANVLTKSVFDSFSGRLDKATISRLYGTYDRMFGYVG
jgi:hypothetical protein